LILRDRAYEHTSACVASIVRLHYAIELSQSSDITYYTSLMGLLTLPEMASGIVIVCLPVSPKFFQSFKEIKFFSSMGASWRSILRVSGSRSFWTSGSRSGEASSNNNKKWTRHNGAVKDSYEMTHGRREGSSDSKMPINTSLEGPQDWKANSQFMRTVQITSKDEPRDASMPELRYGTTNPWNSERWN
jgi:hypothetical protein